jgi:putative peptidoglycan lipid II flippase
VKKILDQINRKTTVGGAAVLISGSYLASRVLGLLRDRLLASHFGISPLTDAYTAAFRLPDLLFALLVSGAFAVAFIPVLTEHWSKQEQAEAWELSSVILNLLVLVTLVAAAVMFIFVEPLTRLLVPEFDPERFRLTVNLTHIMLITPVLFAISSVLGAMQQAFNRFFFNAQASIFYNLGIIAGIVFLSPDFSIYGVAIGVVIGAFLQALLQILGLVGLGYRYRPSFKFGHPGIKKVLHLLVPRSIDQGIHQINYTVQTAIGSGLPAGSLTALYYANNLKNVPLMVFGNAIAQAAFPRMAQSAAAGRRDKLLEDFVTHSRMILFLVIPAATVAILMRGYIVRLLFGFGHATTAATLGWFAGTIIFQSLFFLITRVYYALQDSKTPLYVTLVAIAANIWLSFVLARTYGVVGLPMAQSAIAAVETVVLALILRYRLGTLGLRRIANGTLRMIIANAIMASTIYILVSRVLPLYAGDRGIHIVGPKFAFIAAAAAVAYLVPCSLLQLREARLVSKKLGAYFKRPLEILNR